MQKTFVIDKDKKPVNPVSPKEARVLLNTKKAAVFRTMPFTIILKDSVNTSGTTAKTPYSDLPLFNLLPEPQEIHPLRIKIDPGSKTTGLAVINDKTGEVIWAGELTHRGDKIRNDLLSRRQLRRGRRGRKTRYRKPRFNNRKREDGWIAPSLMSRVYNIETWVKRLMRFAPISDISMELVRFDTQAMLNPEISGVEYQQGELYGYEVREYLLEKFERKCAYCGAENTRLEVEHIVPKSKGGSNKVSNLTIACRSCNEAKGNKDIKDFLKGKKTLLDSILKKTKSSLSDTAAVNSTRFKLLSRLKLLGLPVETGTGGRTKFNRCSQGLEKTHWLDACCVGASTPKLVVGNITPLLIKAMGHGNRQACITDKYGFPISHKKTKEEDRKLKKSHISKQIHTFKLSQPDGSTVLAPVQTGDIAKVLVPKPILAKDKKTVKVNAGVYVSRVSIDTIPSLDSKGKGTNGNLKLSTKDDRVIDKKSKVGPTSNYYKIIQKRDGYQYD